MPKISFLSGGLVIEMYYNEGNHFAAHFHVIEGEMDASIAIETRKILEGKLSRSALRTARRWAKAHREELLENWERARQHQALLRIEGDR